MMNKLKLAILASLVNHWILLQSNIIGCHVVSWSEAVVCVPPSVYNSFVGLYK